MGLQTYRSKRDFKRTREPRGDTVAKKASSARRKAGAAPDGLSYVVQEHHARRLHYDFRLELDGVLLSWAVPKGPSLDPGVKRLAVQTEDHPLAYGGFEGTIPKGEYGAGSVSVWDKGTWIPEGDPHRALKEGRLTFALEGEKLHGGFHLVRTGGSKQTGAKKAPASWLLIKRHDASNDHAESSARNAAPTAPDDAARAMTLSAARKARLPAFIEPQLATLTDKAPDGDDWLHEIKLDGYRMLARCDGDSVRMYSRRGHDWTSRVPSIAAALARLSLDGAMLDGEVVVLKDGISSFQRLQNSFSEHRDSESLYYAFDLLHLGELDLRRVPLRDRKALLVHTLGHADLRAGRVRLSTHLQNDGPAFFENACKLGLEGIISKRADAPYTSGRGRSWLKVKCIKRQEFVIGGYTDPEGARSHFGALLLGVHEPVRPEGTLRRDSAATTQLKYAGRVGTGFSEQSLRELASKLKPLVRKQPPFSNPPRGADARGVHWLEPKLVAEIAFAERTDEGLVRHASFQGLRDDKPADEIEDDTLVPASTPDRAAATKVRARATKKSASKQPLPALRNVRLTHPERVLYPDQGITKAELALYYAQIAEPMLVHLANRPLMLVRCPQGEGAECFYQKHPSQGASKDVQRVPIVDKSGKALEHMMVNDVQGLIALVQVGALEIHAWGCHADDIEHPDQLTFDLDPDEGLPWSSVIEAAHTLRERLQALDLEVFLKTTGGKGLHLVVPIKPKAPWDEAKEFCRSVADAMVRGEPDKYLANISKAKRKGKLLIDYFRNGRGATAVCAYSTRARPGATVAAPIRWDELTPSLRPADFSLMSMPERVASQRSDPWQGFGKRRPVLPRVVPRARKK